MSTWIFQANPATFEVDRYLTSAKDSIIYWLIKQKYYIRKILPGDEVYIWRADGRKKYSGGIIAKGTIISYPSVIRVDKEFAGLWKSKNYANEEYGVRILVEEIRLTPDEGMIPRVAIENDEILKSLKIVNFRQHTNYLVEDKYVNRLRLMWVLKRYYLRQSDKKKEKL